MVAAAWRQSLRSDPGAFTKVKDHPATIRALSNAHRELRDLTGAGRDRIRTATTLSKDLIRLHELVVSRLTEGWYDATDLLDEAARVAEKSPQALTELGAIVLHLPQPLSQSETRFAQSLSASKGVTAVVGLTGVRRADDPLQRTLERLGLPEPDTEERLAPPVATRVLHASDSDDEVRCVVRAVTESLTRHPAHRVAVLYGAAQPYARQLHEHLIAAGLTVNGPATRAVHERAIARGFLAVLELASTDLPRSATFTALAEAPTRTFDGQRVPVARWERISRLAGVVGGGDDWVLKLDRFIEDQHKVIEQQENAEDPRQSRIDAARREISTAEDLSRFVTALRERLVAGAATTSWSDLSEWALALFHDLYGEHDSLRGLPAEEQYAAVVVEAGLRGLVGLADLGERGDLLLLVEVLTLELESALPRVGRYGEGVFVGPVSAVIGMDLDQVFVLGLSEDGYPGRLHEDALLNDTVRTASAGELVAVRDRLDAKHRHLLAAFDAAPDVTACFPRGDLRKSTERLPSRFLLPTLRHLTGNKELAATEWGDSSKYRAAVDGLLISSPSYAYSVLSSARPASAQEWQVRASAAGARLQESAAEMLLAARRMVEARESSAFTRYDGNLEQVTGLPDYAHSDRAVSPTALESYAKCPHGYFVQRLLGVEPVEQPEEIIQISAADTGTLIHAAMDRMITEAQDAGSLPSYGEPWSDKHRKRLRELALDEATEFTERGLTGHRRLWEPELAAILVVLDRMLDDDDRWRSAHDARVVSSELKFGMEGKDPVKVSLSDGEVLMRGSADKVDRGRDGTLLVTDIKSGKADSFKVIEKDPVAAGTKLQLPVYAHAARGPPRNPVSQSPRWRRCTGSSAGTRASASGHTRRRASEAVRRHARDSCQRHRGRPLPRPALQDRALRLRRVPGLHTRRPRATGGPRDATSASAAIPT